MVFNDWETLIDQHLWDLLASFNAFDIGLTVNYSVEFMKHCLIRARQELRQNLLPELGRALRLKNLNFTEDFYFWCLEKGFGKLLNWDIICSHPRVTEEFFDYCLFGPERYKYAKKINSYHLCSNKNITKAFVEKCISCGREEYLDYQTLWDYKIVPLDYLNSLLTLPGLNMVEHWLMTSRALAPIDKYCNPIKLFFKACMLELHETVDGILTIPPEELFSLITKPIFDKCCKYLTDQLERPADYFSFWSCLSHSDLSDQFFMDNIRCFNPRHLCGNKHLSENFYRWLIDRQGPEAMNWSELCLHPKCSGQFYLDFHQWLVPESILNNFNLTEEFYQQYFDKGISSIPANCPLPKNPHISQQFLEKSLAFLGDGLKKFLIYSPNISEEFLQRVFSDQPPLTQLINLVYHRGNNLSKYHLNQYRQDIKILAGHFKDDRISNVFEYLL